MKPYIKFIVLILFLGIFLFLSLQTIVAVSCFSYSTNATCSAVSGCTWKNDSWGAWCQELNCWSLNDQTSCTTSVITGKNCTWQGGKTHSYCTDVSCWSFSGTNQTACESNSNGLSCSWETSCYSSGATTGVNCYSITNENSCKNTTGCSWGNCKEKGCYSYISNTTCNAGKDFRGNNCTWDTSGSYCKENNCWNYANETACNNALGVKCSWKFNSCQEINCWTYDGTNSSACLNNTANLSCKWDGKWCMERGCWDRSDQTTCEQTSDCVWTTWSSGGWCEEVNCWTYDSWNGGNKTQCVNNSYGLNCKWEGSPPGNVTGGWCYKDTSSTSCSNFTTERECMDTFYCWWQFTNFNDPSLGGNCKDPSNFSLTTNNSILNNWNPGCYIFDKNVSNCGLVIGCLNTTAGQCIVNSTHNNANEITTNGLNCTMINDSSLCNNVPVLSSCCAWQNGSCSTDKLSTSCWSQLATPPADSCEGANNAEKESDRKSNCDQISNDPWYMPCEWSNSTKMCQFKTSDVFGNGSKSIIKIENKRNCEAAGGKWISENYCEGNVSVPTGRCEYKFDEEDNCNKACFACELKDSNGNPVNATNAKTACEQSPLGICEFKSDSNAPNGIGFCIAKTQFKAGLAKDCNTDCGACSFKGDPLSNDSTKRPSYFCSQSSANSLGGGCKWVTDNSTKTGGLCMNKGEKTCEDSCDRCYTRLNCQNIGRTKISNQSGSCKWKGDDNDGTCGNNVGEDVEVCWDGTDNNDDGLIDCADPSCYTDSLCGFVEGDCFIWTDNSSCNSNNCEWVVDKWGSWCDFKGGQCWKHDGNESSCQGTTFVVNEVLDITNARYLGNQINGSYYFNLTNLGTGWLVGSITINSTNGTNLAGNYTIDYDRQLINFTNSSYLVLGGGGSINITNVTYRYYANNCKWSNGTGNGWCERDWSITEICMGLNKANCSANNASGCSWSEDSWCKGEGNSSDWCKSGGGWCDHSDFKSKDCWQYSTNASCSSTSGCGWKSDQWMKPQCEVNWSGNCWNYTDNSSCTTNGCKWRSDSWGSWCDNVMGECWNSNTKTACEAVANARCTWRTESWGSYCQPSCFNSTLSNNQNACASVSGCMWKDAGWCEEQQVAACNNLTNYNNQTNCQNSTGCRWKNSGWCDPKDGGFSGGAISGGGGMLSGMGAECYKYDGNQTLCTNKSIINISCGWFPEPNPRCDVNWGTNCWQYLSADAGCNSTNGCWWNPNGNFCGNVMDQCWSNTSLVNNATLCNENAYCNSTNFGGCQPTCFSVTDTNTCATTSGCKWMSGWCNPAGMHEMFDQMDSGAPVPLGVDTCDLSETTQASVDICGFGMKDMGDAFGFGVSVNDFSNASICNKVKIASHAMGFGKMGSDKVGDGNETVELFVYLDTDGNTDGTCALTHNSSSKGFEFRFRYVSEWNSTKSKAVETFNAYKCENSEWKAVDIKISTWKEAMCGEIGGPMIAIEKDDLDKYPTLYNSSEDMKIIVATAGINNNITTPSDSASPGFMTPGSIDFEIDNAFDYGADVAKFEDILREGFVKYEDCYNSKDDDNDGNIDCNDWDCQFADVCSGKGVNATNYTDTSTPKVSGIKIEEYPDAVLVMYDTNKPTNGSLLFYGNDSQCITLNKSIKDIGITSANVRDYKLWHEANIYNNTLGYSLTNNTRYYYKLEVCDVNNKCARSRCSNFTTETNSEKCGYCNFVTRIKVPSDWIVSFDLDQDGTYEHIQGQVCGTNAGMKTNYSDGRSANIKLAKSDDSTYFEFLNVTLTKTGLNDKVRSISDSGAFIHDTSNGFVGMPAETRDKIINNMHPEVCRIKIPYSGTCDALFHCDDNGANCTDRTSDATLLNAANCIWQLPFCEFSTWDEKITADSGTSGSTSGGGGGGGITKASNATNKTTGESSKGITGGVVEEEEKGIDSGKREIITKEEAEEPRVEKSSLTNIIFILVLVVVIVIVFFFVRRSMKNNKFY